MNERKPAAVLLLGERGQVTDEAAGHASALFDLRAVGRYERSARQLGPSVEQVLRSGEAEYLFSFHSPVIVPKDLLARVRVAVNFHPAPPEWPGVGSASYALHAGDKTFGVTAHLMTEHVDSGPIVAVDRFPIRSDESCDELFDRAIRLSEEQFKRVLAGLRAGETLRPTGERWSRRPTTRRDFERWMTLSPADPPEEVGRKVRALRSARFRGPFVEIAGHRFELSPVHRASSTRRERLPWWEPQLAGGELERIRGVLESTYLNDGEVTERFERAVAARVGARHAVAVTSGTMAIFAALVATGVGPGDEVIVPDLTFIATANAVTLTGGRPVLVDIDERTLTIDAASVERAITPRTRAIVPVHVSGRGADMRALGEIARRHGIAIVEDAAEAFVSCQDGRALGTIGAAGCLSFSPNKSITTGQGGMVLTNDDAVARRLREIKDQGRPVRGTGGDDVHPAVGFNLKLTNLQAAVGLAQLDRLDERLDRQRAIHRRYVARLAGVKGLRLPGFRLDDGETPLWTDAVIERRDELDAHLRSNGMDCRRFWFPIHTQAPYRLAGDPLPRATHAARHALWLPSAFTLSDGDVDAVSDRIIAFLGA